MLGLRVALSVSALLVGACRADDTPKPVPRPSTSRAPTVVVHVPDRVTSVENGAGRTACVSCHSQKTPRPLPESAGDLREFHVGLTFRHGSLRCASCHVEGRVDGFRLADGSFLPSSGVMDLCSQCHGPQRRDYEHGAHGGMRGHWDLSRGPRDRNNCVDCHEPHSPRIPSVAPVLPPRDRGSVQGVGHGR